MSESTKPLTFFIAEQKSVVIVTWVGQLNKESQKTMEECGAAIAQKKPKWVILNFRDVAPQVDRSIASAFVLFQKKIRELGAAIRLSSLHPELKKTLNNNGLIRGDELAQNLAEALKTLNQVRAFPAKKAA